MKKEHTTTEKALAAALYAFLADFNDYDGRTHRDARAALRKAGFPIWDAPAASPEPTPLVLIECDGGVPKWRGARGVVECFVLDWDVLDMGAGHDDAPEAFRAVPEWRETLAEFDRRRAEGECGDEGLACPRCANSEADGAKSAECEECELCTVCCPHVVGEEGGEDA